VSAVKAPALDELDAPAIEPRVMPAASELPDLGAWTEARLAIELKDDGAELVEFAAGKGFLLEVVEQTSTSCTVSAARGSDDEHPTTVTFTVEDVERARLDKHPVLGADVPRLLRVWALCDAASARLADVVMELDLDRLRRSLALRGLPSLDATPAEWRHQMREMRAAVKAYRREAFVAFVARPLERARRRRTRRTSARSPGKADPEPSRQPELEAAA
jgi:hypothetical protein